MAEPDETPTAPLACEAEAPSLAAPQPVDTRYGYALPGRRWAQVAVSSIVFAIVAIIATMLPQVRPAIVSLCIILVPLLALALAAAVPLAAAGRDTAPARPLIAGWAAILGGSACDVYATMAQSPDLAREANPIMRGMLDNGVSLVQVYAIVAVMHVLWVGLAMVLWLGLLQHRHTLAGTMPPRGSLLAYFKAGIGGRELSYRQWLCPLRYGDLPWAYHMAWWIGVAFVATGAYRFYLALEWYGVAPIELLWVRLIAPSVILLVTCWWYASWLRGARARLSDAPPTTTA